jgi:pimeloyl-ACP methyl ester carboxylesterase
MREMRLLRLLLLMAAIAAAPLAAQETPKPAGPSPLAFGSEFMHNAGMPDVEALSAALRLELQNDPKVINRDPNLVPLIRVTEQTIQANNNNLAWVFGSRLLAFLSGAKWGQPLDLAISLDFTLDRRVIAPGSLLHARLGRIFRTPAPGPAAQFRIILKDASGKTLWQSPPTHIPPEDPIEVALPVRSLAPGDYSVTYEYLVDAAPLVSGSRGFSVDPSWRQRETALELAAHNLALKGIADQNDRVNAAFRFVQWTVQAMAAHASASPVAGTQESHPVIETWAYRQTPRFWSTPLSLPDVERAESLARALQSGADPFAGSEDLRLAFHSSADQSFRTFRLFLPSTLPADAPVPLVVLLHGFAGDESSWLDRLPGTGAILRRLAAERGFAILAPSARSRYSRFEGPDLADIEQLKSIVMRIRPIDPERIALIGHGPAAFTAINAALASSEKWPVAVGIAGLPTGLPAATEGSRPRLLFEYAAGDKLFAVAEGRKWAYLLQKRIPGFESRELPDVDNAHAPAACIERAISFFLDPPPVAAAPPPEAPKQ